MGATRVPACALLIVPINAQVVHLSKPHITPSFSLGLFYDNAWGISETREGRGDNGRGREGGRSSEIGAVLPPL